ncbi:MAG TPA: hypothetical protein VHV49_00620 [Pseudonocardiaceae bacterium]|nr:hypothetical protein [Pseudonocardiaceae bacterium]
MTNLTKSLHGLLATSGLPEPVMISLDYHDARISIQPAVNAYTDPVAVLSALLLWSRLLHGITATWRHSPEGNLHITIDGRLQSGTRVRLYQGVPFDTVREWVLLAPGQRDSVSLDELAGLIRDLHTTRPAA